MRDRISRISHFSRGVVLPLRFSAQPPDDGLVYAPTVEALGAWIDHHWKEWYDDPIAELEYRDAIRDQALGIAYTAHDLDIPARYEVHLDRKLCGR